MNQRLKKKQSKQLIRSVRRMTVNEGDVIVFNANMPMDSGDASYINNYLSKIFPKNNCMVCVGGQLQILSFDSSAAEESIYVKEDSNDNQDKMPDM